MASILTQCDALPLTNSYILSSLSRSVGQIVKVTCTEYNDPGSISSSNSKKKAETMTTVLKCLPDLKWNDTIPACNVDDEEDGSSTGLILILIWTVGGVLLFTLFLLTALIIRSKNKTVTDQTRPGSQPSSVFTVRGANLGRDWADNPAFSRADERCAELAPTSNNDQRSPMRLPTYQEAILSNYLINGRDPPQYPSHPNNPARQNNGGTTLTVADVHSAEVSNFVRVNAPPSYRSSQLQHSRYHTGNGNVNTAAQSSSVSVSAQVSQSGLQNGSNSAGQSESAAVNQMTPSSESNQSARRTDPATGGSSQSTTRVGGDGRVASSSQSPRRTTREGRCSGTAETVTPFRGTGTTATENPVAAISTTLAPTLLQLASTSTSTSLSQCHQNQRPQLPPSSSSIPSQSEFTTTSTSSSQHQNQQPPLPSASSITSASSPSSSALVSRRYAEQYPSCFFEDEPPPPYTPCSALYRSPTRRTCPTTNPHRHHHHHHQHHRHHDHNQQHQQYFNREEPSRRTLHSIPLNSTYRGTQHSNGPLPSHHLDHPNSPNTPVSSNSNHQSANESPQGRNATPNSPAQQNSSQNSAQRSHLTNVPNFSSVLTSSLTYPSPSSSLSTPCTVSLSTNYPRDSGYSSINTTNLPSTSQHWASSSRTSENSTINIPRPQLIKGASYGFQEPINGISQTSLPASNGEIQGSTQVVSGNTLSTLGLRAEGGDVRSENGNPLYIIRCSQATPSAPPPDSLPSLIHLEAPPLGTSTPINQSPAVPRRFAPPIRPVNQTDPKIVLSGYVQEPIRDHYGLLDTPIVHGATNSRQPCSQEFPQHGKHRYESPRVSAVSCVSQYGHSRHTSAPLARLESEYF